MIQPADFVASRLYEREEDVWRDAVRALTWLHPEYKREIAIRRYQNGEISLAKTAHLAGMAFEEMKELLVARGIEVHLGPETWEELEADTDVLRRSLGESSHQ